MVTCAELRISARCDRVFVAAIGAYPPLVVRACRLRQEAASPLVSFYHSELFDTYLSRLSQAFWSVLGLTFLPFKRLGLRSETFCSAGFNLSFCLMNIEI